MRKDHLKDYIVAVSVHDTHRIAADLALMLYERHERVRKKNRSKDFSETKGKVFVELNGILGAGKTEFARAFIESWLKRAGDKLKEQVTSPTYNIARTYGEKTKLAHLDLYRLKTFAELEEMGFETYFYETDCCLVEWLEQVPEAKKLIPHDSILARVALEIETENSRRITITENEI